MTRIENCPVSVPPAYCAAGAEKVYCYTRRNDEDNRISLIEFRAGDGRVLATYDARALPDFGDTALAAPFVSTFTLTLKAFVSYIPASDHNARCIEPIDTGIIPAVTL